MQVLILIYLEVAELENAVAFVVSCYDVESLIPYCCKSDIIE